MRKKLVIIVYILLSCLALYSVIAYRKEISDSVFSSINYGIYVLIPSLFPMIFVSSFISFSKASEFLSFVFSFVCRKFFRLPSCCVCAIIFGICCGYPVGAKLTASLLEQKKINSEQANRLLCFCVNAGIPFAVIFVGCGIFSSLKMGMFIFVSNTIASIIIGFVLGIRKDVPKKEQEKRNAFTFDECISLSAKSSLLATVNLCLYVIIFSCFIEVLKVSGVFELIINNFFKVSVYSKSELTGLLSFFFDVVSGANSSETLGLSSNIYILGLSFAGLCVHFQIFSFFKAKTIKFFGFYFSRFANSCLSYEIFQILKEIFPTEISVFSSTDNLIPKISQNGFPLTFCLILLVCTYIFSNKRLEKTEKM
ncbi:MAG: hypothetical protein R3Y33_02045 [Clostridia bacterium]